MRTALLVSAALLAFGGAAGMATEANAQERVRYTGYFYGLDHPRELADLIEAALERDPSGRTMLDRNKCRIDGSCAAPINYLESFQQKDPHGGWTLENMAEKMRTLRLDCDMEGIYQMDRIRVRPGASLGETDLNGMSRSFETDECAWVNPETGRPVLAENCTNPVGVRIDLVCVYVNIEVRDSNEYALIWQRRVRADDPCFAYRRVTRVFEPDTPSAQWHEVPRGCIGRPCDFTAVNEALGGPHVAQGQIPLDSPGLYQVRLSPDELPVFCVKYRLPNGDVRSSFAVGVRWSQDYLTRVEDERHARIFYSSGELRTQGIGFNQAGGLAFWASTREDEAAIRRGFPGIQ